MLKTILNKFSLIFTTLVVIELIVIQLDNSLHYITKPLIVLSLIAFFITQHKHLDKKIRVVTLIALSFSLLGDIFLMFVDKNQLYFMLGLGAFLLAHIMYIIAFKAYFLFKNKLILVVIILLCYAFYIYSLLKPNLGEMLIPVILYMAVILCMALLATGRFKVNINSYYLVLIGAILFLISDSILALNKFYKPLFSPNISIMLTYAFAQYFIVLGILKQHH